jgi:hypothetical protein
LTEHNRVQDPPRKQREQPGDNQRTGENQDHDAAMIRDLMRSVFHTPSGTVMSVKIDRQERESPARR